MKRLSVLLALVGLASCGPRANPQLDSEVARLRLEVKALEAKSARCEASRAADPETRVAEADTSHESEAKLNSLADELDELKREQERILEELRKVGKPRPMRPQRPRPKPEAVYSIDLSDSPFRGAKNAKVTIVKAFEFA